MLEAVLKQARILIVDEADLHIDVVASMLRPAGFVNCRAARDSRQVLSWWAAVQPDLLVLIPHMAHLDWFTILGQIKSRFPDFPVLILAPDPDPEIQLKHRALSLGADDFLSMPLDPDEVIPRVTNLLQRRFLYQNLLNQKHALEQTVGERTRQFNESQRETIRRLALAAEFRDDNTGQHVGRVGQISGAIGRAIGLPESQVELIEQAAPLHDVGKIAMPDEILLKPGTLTTTEYELVKTHTDVGVRILSGSRSPVLQLAEEIALYHHERWDGTGYAGLCGEAIPLAPRIVAVADVYDVLTHDRPYKKAWTNKEALAEIEGQSGKHFDPHLVEAFLRTSGGTEVPFF